MQPVNFDNLLEVITYNVWTQKSNSLKTYHKQSLCVKQYMGSTAVRMPSREHQQRRCGYCRLAWVCSISKHFHNVMHWNHKTEWSITSTSILRMSSPVLLYQERMCAWIIAKFKRHWKLQTKQTGGFEQHMGSTAVLMASPVYQEWRLLYCWFVWMQNIYLYNHVENYSTYWKVSV